MKDSSKPAAKDVAKKASEHEEEGSPCSPITALTAFTAPMRPSNNEASQKQMEKEASSLHGQ